jgi:hypothetical protein
MTAPPNPFEDRAEDVARFIRDLAAEGERSAVVLGASRADTVLEELLTVAMRPHPGNNDNLFDPDRPLGTFSARISLAFRLGLIDSACEHALQMLRKIRNDFAHSVSRTSLNESHHKSRVTELVREAKKDASGYDMMFGCFEKTSGTLRAFCTAVSVIISQLEHAAVQAKQIQPPFVVRLDVHK